MTIGQKADYVRSAIAEDLPLPVRHLSAQAGTGGGQTAAPKRTSHQCHWPGCAVEVSPAQWGCRAHWYRLPAGLRRKVWVAFRPGQEISKTPSRRYAEIAQEVRDWIVGQKCE